MLSHRLRDLAHYLHAFNDMQLELLGTESSRDGIDKLLHDLVARFIEDEYARRYRRQRRLDEIVFRERPPERVREAAAAARNLAGELAQRGAAPLTAAEALPVVVFFEQLAMRLDAGAATEQTA
ncbi:MAG: hypothetical protein ING59_00055 [Burkholderiales bacterium]|nr:hypothetical protein [Burkholderiales bacterium]